jgi:hypothetical protein
MRIERRDEGLLQKFACHVATVNHLAKLDKNQNTVLDALDPEQVCLNPLRTCVESVHSTALLMALIFTTGLKVVASPLGLPSVLGLFSRRREGSQSF